MIRIDMKIPESCAVCPFEVYDGEEDYYFCAYTDKLVTQMRDCRHKSCPLKECPHGEWIDYSDEKYSYLANCSKCGYQMNTREEHGYFTFCPNCGASMSKKEGETE